jgi:nucleoside-diphosphate-sugar epimerase
VGLGRAAVADVGLSGRTVLVTGATGLVGRALVAALGDRGARVAAFAGEVTDARALAEAVAARAPDAVVHLAGRAVDGGEGDEVWRVNAEGTRAVLAAAGRARVVVASSVAAYAPVPAGTEALTEDLALLAADAAGATAYARSKAAADAAARAAGATVARLANVYGAGDRNASRLVPELAAAAAAHRPPVLRSAAATPVDLLHADDAAAALVALTVSGAAGEAYNIGSGATVTVGEVVAAAERALGRALHPVYGTRPGPSRPPAAIAKVAAVTGWRPRIGLDEGLRRTLTG